MVRHCYYLQARSSAWPSGGWQASAVFPASPTPSANPSKTTRFQQSGHLLLFSEHDADLPPAPTSPFETSPVSSSVVWFTNISASSPNHRAQVRPRPRAKADGQPILAAYELRSGPRSTPCSHNLRLSRRGPRPISLTQAWAGREASCISSAAPEEITERSPPPAKPHHRRRDFRGPRRVAYAVVAVDAALVGQAQLAAPTGETLEVKPIRVQNGHPTRRHSGPSLEEGLSEGIVMDSYICRHRTSAVMRQELHHRSRAFHVATGPWRSDRAPRRPYGLNAEPFRCHRR